MNKPNIILINCDDLGYGDLETYGSEHNDTPALNQLTQEGMRFTDFYVSSPVCSASRSSLMTGCYSQRIGFGPHQVLMPGSKAGLNPKETSIAKVLKQAGYATKIIGKWHCGDQPEFLPVNHGFDEYFGIPFSNDMGRQVTHLDAPPLPLVRNDEVIQQQPDQRGITERYVDESLQFIRKNDNEPFFLYLAHMYVHVPLFVPKQFLDISRNGAYGGAVGCIDWALASIDAELERLGLKENTLLIFTSDNGSRARDEGGSNLPCRGRKAQTWEGGMRVPCIMRWPGKIPAGSTNTGIASTMDFYETLAELAGVETPKTKTDSLSLTGTMLNGEDSPREIMAYYSGQTLNAVRLGDWKLHFHKDTWPNESTGDNPMKELYNLREDVSETTNLYDQQPEIVEQIKLVADQYRKMLGDKATGIKGEEIRPIDYKEDAKPLTEYDPNHPYMVAYYDLADMPTMYG